MDRATAIRRSLTCFVCGIIGMIPIIGLLPAMYTVIWGLLIHHRYRDWNPAARYLNWGTTLAALGLAQTLLLLGLLIVALI
jgi:hypothetical protein